MMESLIELGLSIQNNYSVWISRCNAAGTKDYDQWNETLLSTSMQLGKWFDEINEQEKALIDFFATGFVPNGFIPETGLPNHSEAERRADTKQGNIPPWLKPAAKKSADINPANLTGQAQSKAIETSIGQANPTAAPIRDFDEPQTAYLGQSVQNRLEGVTPRASDSANPSIPAEHNLVGQNTADFEPQKAQKGTNAVAQNPAEPNAAAPPLERGTPQQVGQAKEWPVDNRPQKTEYLPEQNPVAPFYQVVGNLADWANRLRLPTAEQVETKGENNQPWANGFKPFDQRDSEPNVFAENDGSIAPLEKQTTVTNDLDRPIPLPFSKNWSEVPGLETQFIAPPSDLAAFYRHLDTPIKPETDPLPDAPIFPEHLTPEAIHDALAQILKEEYRRYYGYL